MFEVGCIEAWMGFLIWINRGFVLIEINVNHSAALIGFAGKRQTPPALSRSELRHQWKFLPSY